MGDMYSLYMKPAAKLQPKTLPHLLGLDSPHQVIPEKPEGHVGHMVPRSLIGCTTRHTFMMGTWTGTNYYSLSLSLKCHLIELAGL